ncbi:uncharacterized protein [Eurosta solidaginis]|uniref:uncharacterized protein isoform X2 n=1 Tax=Eurosta solidaginis TaxID=178769 RepID=UPI0035306023
MVSEGNKNRYSQLNWLKKYEWLAYSKIAGGGLCKMRVLFGRREASSNDVKLGKLVSEPLSKYKKAIDAIKHHESNNYHKANMVESKNFLMVMEGKSVNVFERMRSQEMEIIKNNGEKLILIIKTIILCGRENIPLRSHRDDGSLEANSSYEHGEGNFRALLKFRVDAGDMILQEHAEKFAANASYLELPTSAVERTRSMSGNGPSSSITLPKTFGGVPLSLKQQQTQKPFLLDGSHTTHVSF